MLVVAFTGDGGNDVSMIQAANVGVGIIGKVCIGLFHLTDSTTTTDYYYYYYYYYC